MTLTNAQRVPVTGWYEDNGGDRFFLVEGSLAPICPRHGLTLTVWRLIAAFERSARRA